MTKKTTKAGLARELKAAQFELEIEQQHSRRLHKEVMKAENERDSGRDDNTTLKRIVAELTSRVAQLEGYCHRIHELDDREMVMARPPEIHPAPPPDYRHTDMRPVQRHRPSSWSAAEMLANNNYDNDRREDRKEWWQL